MKSYFSEDLIKQAIARKLKECLAIVSGSDVTYPVVFADKIMQGAVEPFFLILVINVSQDKGLGIKFWRKYQLKVQYYIDEQVTTKITDLRKMGERLFGILDTIDLEYKRQENKIYTRPLRAYKLDFEITENVLNFFCTYKVRVQQDVEPDTKMQILDINRMEEI